MTGVLSRPGRVKRSLFDVRVIAAVNEPIGCKHSATVGQSKDSKLGGQNVS